MQPFISSSFSFYFLNGRRNPTRNHITFNHHHCDIIEYRKSTRKHTSHKILWKNIHTFLLNHLRTLVCYVLEQNSNFSLSHITLYTRSLHLALPPIRTTKMQVKSHIASSLNNNPTVKLCIGAHSRLTQDRRGKSNDYADLLTLHSPVKSVPYHHYEIER